MVKRNIILIGASRGIGKELALSLAKEHQVLVLSRNLEKLDEINKSCGDSLMTARIDLNTPNINEQLTEIIKEKHVEEVDVLINNAGYLVNKPFLETTEEDIRAVYETNVIGLISSCQAVIPFMKKGGHIVNIGSVGGVQGSVKFPGISIYSSSKAAVAGFTECLAEELKDERIAVNCLALGAVQTEMLAEAFPAYQTDMQAEQMAEFIADFALNGQRYMNGKIIPVSKSTP